MSISSNVRERKREPNELKMDDSIGKSDQQIFTSVIYTKCSRSTFIVRIVSLTPKPCIPSLDNSVCKMRCLWLCWKWMKFVYFIDARKYPIQCLNLKVFRMNLSVCLFFCCFLWITKQVSSFSNGKRYCKQSTRIELSEVTVRTMEIAQQKNRYFYEPPKCLRNDWRSIKNGGR